METSVPTSADTSERRHTVLRARREWSVAEKRAIVAETRLPGANVSAISRHHGAAQSLIYQWRKIFGPTDLTPTGSTPAFLPVAIAAPVPRAPAMAEPVISGMIEIVLANGRRVRVDASADPAKLARLVAALDGGS
jgi:transposase